MACISSRSPRNPEISSKKVSPRATSGRSHEESSNNENEDEDKDQVNQVYAQKLNNTAAMCIEIGYYEKATQHLQKALEFYQKLGDENLIHVCQCDKCKVDGCIDFSADFAPVSGKAKASRRRSIGYIGGDGSDNEEEDYSIKKSISKEDINFLTKSISNPKLAKVAKDRRRRGSIDGEKNATWSIKDEFCEEELDRYEDEDDGIYKRPIRVLREGHPMGGLLFLTITFNLALTHHLDVAASCSKKRYDSMSAKKALLFYELTSSHETRLLSDKGSNRWHSLSSIRFNKILNSNLNQLFQYLPEMSLPSVRNLVSKVWNSIDQETERLSGIPSSRRTSLTSEGSCRWSNDGDSSRSMPRTLSRDHNSRSPVTSRSPRASRRPSARRKSRNNSLGGGSLHSLQGSPTTSRTSLQHALGDMAPATRRLSC